MNDRHPERRPSLADGAGEWAAVGQVPRLVARAPWLLRERRGRGEPVVVLPGRGVGDASTVVLRGFLTALGYRCGGWGLGVNDGNVGAAVDRFTTVLEMIVERHGAPVALVGQSMGGTVAREVARARPDLVAQVITLGSPIFSPLSNRPLRVPMTVMYSRADRIVPYPRSVDRTPGSTNVEVTSPHMGMGIDPDVWRVVARQLRTGAEPGEPDGARG